MGLLADDDLEGTLDRSRAGWRPACQRERAAAHVLPVFRWEFQAEKPVARAVLYACGLGQAEYRLNGRKIGDDLLQPGWTNYRKSCLYQTYDVTGMIRWDPMP